MAHNISVSKEYLDTVCDWLESWSLEEDSWIIPQFLKKYGLGWSYFHALMALNPELFHSFEVVVSGLAAKWMLYGFSKSDLPTHMQKIMMKYLLIYDTHALEVEKEAKNESDKPKFSVTDYATEDYSKERLEGLYKRLYELNVDKRRSSKSSE